MRHVPVLINEVIEQLQLKKGDRVIDCTLGDGGHTEAILDKTAPTGRVLGLDADPESLLRAKRYLYRFEDRLICVRDNFGQVGRIAREQDFTGVNGILMDLGWSSPQFEERGRGFSFDKDEPLDMRFNPMSQNQDTAAEIIKTYSRDELVKIFKQYGEEDLAWEIASAIVEQRKDTPIVTTAQLTELVLAVYRQKIGTTNEIPWIGGLHPATKTYQALRLAVNQELEVLKQALPQAFDLLGPNGRLAVITFHSLEDRIVKRYFQSLGATAQIITKKPLIATDEELAVNPRARSAKLRVIQKI